MEDPMIILASDTSTKSLSVAICRDGIPIGSVTEQTGTTHCQTHMPAIQKLLAESGLSFSDIDLYACTVGPGSYTGIRIGVSTTKTMAYASKKGAVGVSTLETLAISHLSGTRMVCPILDARNRRVFSSGYVADNLAIPEANRSIEDLLALISDVLGNRPAMPGNEKPGMDLVFCGDTASAYQEDPVVKEKLRTLLDAHLLHQALFLDTVPQAADTAAIAYHRFCLESREAKAFDPFALQANYLSPSQAERMKKSRAANLQGAL